MARGIISTILGGVAGGLEGRRDQYLRGQELDEQKRREELERNRWLDTQRINLQSQGFRPLDAALQQAGQFSEAGQGMEMAPNIMIPGGGAIQTSAIGRALGAAGEQQQRNIERGFQVGLGDDTYVLDYSMTPRGIEEARQAREDQLRAEDIERENYLIRAERAYLDKVRNDEQFFDRELRRFDRETQMQLAEFGRETQLEVIEARWRLQNDPPENPEDRIWLLQTAFLNSLQNFRDPMTNALDPAAVDYLATIYGNMAGIDGPTFRGIALGSRDDDDVVPPDPDSGVSQRTLELVRRPEETERERRARAEQIQVDIDFLERQLANPDLDPRRRRDFATYLNQLRGDLARASGSLMPYRVPEMTPTSRLDYDY